MARVKICGINDAAALDAAVDHGAGWIGFVFFPPSPRYVSPSQARTLSERRRGGPLRVGLFVKPVEAEIEAVLTRVSLDILQLYGVDAAIPALRERFGLPVWRAVGVDSAADLPLFLDHADGLVIEAKPPPEATRPGGNATRFDWTVTRNWTAPGPWMLAGGLEPENVAEAIRQSGAGAVDVSSGVERAKGVKDAARIAAFIRAAKEA